jgi:hypothetical protein
LLRPEVVNFIGAYIPKAPNISYEEARENLLKNIISVREKIMKIDTKLRLPNESVLCIRVSQEYAAKSYYPTSLFYPANQGSELEEIGSRLWRINTEKESENAEFAKLFYIRTTEAGLDKFHRKLSQTANPSENFQLDIRRLSNMELLTASDRVAGFSPEWEGGTIELTLHPFSLDRSRALSHFKELISSYDVNMDQLRIKQYDNEGLTFISLHGNKQLLNELAEYNPLRSVHPLAMRTIPVSVRSTLSPGCPQLPTFTKKPSVVVGVIDGGYNPGNPALDRYVEIKDAVTSPAHPFFANHGSDVTSAVLYGAIHTFKNSDTLPEPDLVVRNFRVLSIDTKDPELYDVIDEIEKIVPANPDIQVYNLSLGPQGPIIDADIHRFTYALDLLSKKYNVLFCVAVGNDGDMSGYNRIQSPSDMVNGMAVGAFTMAIGKPERASYSCIGPGREGNKMKPDISALGGCDRSPIQLLSTSAGNRTYTYGTSFASPLAAGLNARLIGKSNGVINALTSRALVLHQAESTNDKGHCTELGHGILPESIDNMMSCDAQSYTLIFEGEVERSKYREFQIPWIPTIQTGKVNFRWTVAVQSAVDPNSPEDYTTSSIELSFYPNSQKFNFKDPRNGKNRRIDISRDPDTADALEAAGWIKSSTPVSESSPKQFAPEGELRKELKWDTVDTRTIPKMAKSLKSPMFHVHAIGRGHRNAGEKVKFAIVLTVEATGTTVDLYSQIVANYPALLPIKMDIPVSVNVTT